MPGKGAWFNNQKPWNPAQKVDLKDLLSSYSDTNSYFNDRNANRKHSHSDRYNSFEQDDWYDQDSNKYQNDFNRSHASPLNIGQFIGMMNSLINKKSHQNISDLFQTNQSPEIDQIDSHRNIKLLNKQSQQIRKKPLQKYTIRDVLQLSLQRKQYLKTLSVDKLSQEPETVCIFKDPETVYLIGQHFSSEIKDQTLKRQIQSLKNKDILADCFGVFSVIAYMYSVEWLEKYSPFKGKLQKRYHWVFPPVFILWTVLWHKNIQNRKKNLAESYKSNDQFMKIIKRYLCETTEKQRKRIIEFNWQTN